MHGQRLDRLLDTGSEAEVRGHWDELAAAGLPSMAQHTDPSNRPHVTLTVVSQQVPDDVERSFAALATGLPIRLTIGAPILFGQGPSRILCRFVVPNERLLQLQARADDALGSLPRVPHLGPGQWTPHLTLIRRIRLADVPRALEAIGDVRERHGQAVAVRRWDSEVRRTWLLDEHDR